MGLDVYQGKIECPASTGTYNLTAPGFTGKALIVWCTSRTSDGSSAHSCQQFGFAQSSDNMRSICGYSEDSAADSFAGMRLENRTAGTAKSCCLVQDYNSTVLVDAYLEQWTANGADLYFRTVTSGLDIHYIILGGSDIESVFAGDETCVTSPGTKNVTNVGFQGDLGIFVPTHSVAGYGTVTHSIIALGAAKSSSSEWGLSGYQRSSSAKSQTGRGQRTDATLNVWYVTEIQLYLADFTQWTSNGFDLYFSTAPGSAYRFFYLILKGSFQSQLGAEDQKTSGTPPVSHEIATSFEGKVALLAGFNNVATDARQNHHRISIGGGESQSRRACTWTGDEDNSVTTNVSLDSDTTKVLKHMTENSGSPSTQAELDFASTPFDSDSANFQWSTLDATARRFLYLILGEGEAAFQRSIEIATAAASGLDANPHRIVEIATAAAVGLDANPHRMLEIATATAVGIDLLATRLLEIATAAASAYDTNPERVLEIAIASATGLEINPHRILEIAEAIALAIDVTGYIGGAAFERSLEIAVASASGLDVNVNRVLEIALAVAVALDINPHRILEIAAAAASALAVNPERILEIAIANASAYDVNPERILEIAEAVATGLDINPSRALEIAVAIAIGLDVMSGGAEHLQKIITTMIFDVIKDEAILNDIEKLNMIMEDIIGTVEEFGEE